MPAINQNITAMVMRELTDEDIALKAVAGVDSKTPRLNKLRAVHHAAARLLATGMKAQEVSMTVGLCASRISILKNDPAFNDLIQHYETQEEERFACVQDRMVMLGMVAAEELQDRIIDNPDDVATRDLTEILRHSLDRGGYAPVQKSETKNTMVMLDADSLDKIKQSTQEAQHGRVIHRRPTKTLPASARVDSAGDANDSGAVSGAKTLEGLTLEGLDL